MSIFTQSVKKNRQNNQFDLSYETKLTTQFGRLTPFYLEETLPGDNVQVKSDIYTEFAPLLSNLKHMIDVHVDFFYVPYYSIWDNWDDFISGGEKYDQSPTLPYVTYNDAGKADFKTGTLADYFGIPVWDKDAAAPTVTSSRQYNALPFMAYQHIYNEWYRDQDLITAVDIEKDTDGARTGVGVLQLRKSAWENDLFTSARPKAQKGDPIRFLSKEWKKNTTPPTTATDGAVTISADASGLKTLKDGGSTAIINMTTIQDLRYAEGLQAFVEAMQRGGNRYNEYLNTMWGVEDQNRRLNIPELLYSKDHPLKVNEVITTTNADNTTTDDNTAGQAYGRATAYANNQGFNFTAPDYGVVIGIVKYVPRPAYWQGLREYWARTDRFEWYTDHLANIGEDAITDKELYLTLTDPGNATLEDTFGYHHRYYGFKSRYDQVSGDFRYSLKFQHLGRELNAVPNLNQNFIEIGNTFDTGLTRIFNVISSTDHYIWVQVYNDALYNRDVSYHSIPLS